jgi:hypothetical protein
MGKSWQKRTCKILDSKQISTQQPKERVPDAQMVFLILDQS